jgi:WD40 repeat protein
MLPSTKNSWDLDLRFLVWLCLCVWPFGVFALQSDAQAQQPKKLPVFGLKFSPDGKRLAAAVGSSEEAGPIVIWNVADWGTHLVHRQPHGSVHIDFSSDSRLLAYALRDGKIGILDVVSGQLIKEIAAHSNAVFSVAFLADGKWLVSSGADGLIKVWDVATGEMVRTLEGHADTVYGIAVSPDGLTLLSGSGDKQARLWDLGTGQVKQQFQPSDLIVRRVAFSRDGQYFLTSRWDGKVRIRETTTGRLRAILTSGSHSADMTSDNRLVSTSGQGSTAHLFHIDLQEPSPEQERRIRHLINQFGHESYEEREKAAADILTIGMVAERLLREAMDSQDAEVRIRARRLRGQILSPQPIAELPGHSGDVEVVSFSPDGKLLATACRGGDIKVWSTDSYALLQTLHQPVLDTAAD